jgi:hypothetical protein
MSKAQQLVDIFSEMYGESPRTISADEIKAVAKQHDIPSLYRILNKNNLAENGEYNFPPVGKSSVSSSIKVKKIPNITKVVPNNVVPTTPVAPTVVANLNAESQGFSENLIPEKNDLFVPFGNYKTAESIIKSQQFYPMFITGLSGNGKTEMVEQACAKLKREVIRVNFTVETDEDDLIGGFRLVNGDTKFVKGPVIRAMERGAVLLADEIDLANPARVMCLQSILEGKGYFIKKTGEYIQPASGFTVVATANTKGKGSDDGRFIGTNVLNEAFLERFPITCEQEYPSVAIEKKILGKQFESLGIQDTAFIDKLVDWADIIRKTFMDGGVDELISTRRLVHIAKAYSIFGDRMTAIKLCINRFDDDTKVSFADLYLKIDSEANDAQENNDEDVDTQF